MRPFVIISVSVWATKVFAATTHYNKFNWALLLRYCTL